ncbi:MAG: hypothetical protein U1F65_04010 [Verrucomicrobiota bacterium]
MNTAATPSVTQTAAKFRWWLFAGILLAPLVLTLLSTVMMRVFSSNNTNEGVSPLVCLLASVVSGIICGTMVGMRARSPMAQFFLVIGLSFVFFIVGLGLGCFGCGIGGYHMRF